MGNKDWKDKNDRKQSGSDNSLIPPNLKGKLQIVFQSSIVVLIAYVIGINTVNNTKTTSTQNPADDTEQVQEKESQDIVKEQEQPSGSNEVSSPSEPTTETAEKSDPANKRADQSNEALSSDDNQESKPQSDDIESVQKDKNRHQLGDPIEIEWITIRITEVIRDVQLFGHNPVGEYVIVRGEITNSSDETRNLAGSNFRLKDSDGRIYKEASYSANYHATDKYDAKRPSSDIPPGLTTEFAIAFDVGPDTTGLELVWKSGVLGSYTQYVTLGEGSYSNEVSFDVGNYPLRSCGDRLPQDDSQYPVKLFPVFVEYSNDTLAAIKSDYCKDAFKVTRDNGGQVVQVASFTTRNRASEFSIFLLSQFRLAEVGEPTVITEPNQ